MSKKKNSTSIVLGKRHLEWLATKPRGFSFSSLIRELLDAHLGEQDLECVDDENNSNRQSV